MTAWNSQPSTNPASAPTSDLVVHDPVCGAALNPGTSAAERWYDMAVYHFCSSACAAAFRREPPRFARPRPPHEPS